MDLSGKYFSCSEGSARFYDALGARLENGNFALYRSGADISDSMDEWHPENPLVTEPFEKCINWSRGRRDFAQIQVSAVYGVLFFLRGGLTAEHLANAQEHPDFIDIPNVDLGDGCIVTVRVIAYFNHGVVPADAEGNLL